MIAFSVAYLSRFSVGNLSFDRLNYRIDAAINPITYQAIFTFLPRAVLFNWAIRGNIVKSPVEKLRRGIHHRVYMRVAVNQDKISWLFIVGIKLADKVFTLSPQCKRAVGIVQGDIVQVFKVSHVDKYAVG